MCVSLRHVSLILTYLIGYARGVRLAEIEDRWLPTSRIRERRLLFREPSSAHTAGESAGGEIGRDIAWNPHERGGG
jgi:hypothetical protein